jgi:hypothetical protein
MGFLVTQKLQCDCRKSLIEISSMKLISKRQLNENYYEVIFQCKYCNRSIKSVIRVIYDDTHKGMRVE